MNVRRGVLPSSMTAPVGLLLTGLLLSGCGDQVSVAAPDLEAAAAERCEALVADLPETLMGTEQREVDPAEAPAAAWGDPAVVLECGAPEPGEFDEFSACTDAGGVGWFIPEGQLKDSGVDVELTAMSHTPRVRVSVPRERRSTGADEVMAVVGPLVREHLEETSPCH